MRSPRLTVNYAPCLVQGKFVVTRLADLKKGKDHPYRFTLELDTDEDSRSYVLSCDTTTDVQGWVDLLTSLSTVVAGKKNAFKAAGRQLITSEKHDDRMLAAYISSPTCLPACSVCTWVMSPCSCVCT